MAVTGGRADPSYPSGNPPAVGVDREDLSIERVHHHAAGDIFTDAGETGEKIFGFRIAVVRER